MEETVVPGEKHRLTPSHWNFVTKPGQDSNPDSGEKQRAVSGGSVEHDVTTMSFPPVSILTNCIQIFLRNALHRMISPNRQKVLYTS